MTCIVGLVSEGITYMGGDSSASDGYTVDAIATPKVFKTGEYLIGWCGSFRFAQIIQYMTGFTSPSGRDIDAFMAVEFAAEIRKSLKTNKYDVKKNESDLLVGLRGRLYRLQTDFSIIRVRTSYDVIGSGTDVALGALHALHPYDIAPRERVMAALKAATVHGPFIRGPYTIITSEVPA